MNMFALIPIVIGMLLIVFNVNAIKKQQERNEDSIDSLVMIALCLVVIYIIGVKNLPYPDTEEYRPSSSVPIVSIKTENNPNTPFTLRFYKDGSTKYFELYKNTEKGGLKFTVINASLTQIKKSDNDPPQLVTYTKYYQYTSPWKTYIKGQEVVSEGFFNTSFQVLIVPTNTIEVNI